MRAELWKILRLISNCKWKILDVSCNFVPRAGDEMDQVAHGRWGRNEESDVSDAPITGDSESGSVSRSGSQSNESRTPSRSPTPRRELDERSQSRGSFTDGIETVAILDEKRNNINSPKEDPRDKLPPYLPSVYGCRSVEEFQVNYELVS